MFGRRTYSDEVVVAEIRKGNKEALVYLYESNFSSVRNLVMKNSGKPEDVEDILQDAVVAVWQKVHNPDFELTAKLSTFLYAIAKNLWFKQLNKNKRLETMEDRHHNMHSERENLISRADRHLVVEYMEKLGETCRNLLHLFYFEELEMKEIAVRLNFANSDTAKAKKYQCFKKLEQMVKAHFQKSDFLE